jgi:hypothetical protein
MPAEWPKLSKDILKEVRASPGVYWIRTERTIERLLGRDDDGLLMIGRTTDLHARLQSFRRDAGRSDGKGNHSEGVTYGELHLRSKFVPVEDLRIRWRELTKAGAKREEGRLLRVYERTFGELPPLNRARGRPPIKVGKPRSVAAENRES